MRRVLVVEDHSFMRGLVGLHLRGAGYIAEMAEDAVTAARLILHSAPDLMVVDVEMPHWDGIEFCATLRADKTIRYFPIIVMTASEAHAQRASGLGLHVLLKPFMKDQLLGAIASQLAPSADPDAAPRFNLSSAAPP